jgi:hypothetical protein
LPGVDARGYTNLVGADVHVRSDCKLASPKWQTSHAILLTFERIPMRRFAAHFALAAIYATLLAPVVLAAQESSLHACCLRTGTHHCHGDSSEDGFHSKTSACPYFGPLSPTASFGLEPDKFSINSPAVAAFIVQHAPTLPSLESARNLSARAPPSSLL